MVAAKNRMFRTQTGRIITVQDAAKAGLIDPNAIPKDEDAAIAFRDKLVEKMTGKDKEKLLDAAGDRVGYKINRDIKQEIKSQKKTEGGKSRITTQDVEAEPWKYTADVYAAVKGAERSPLGEISGTQLSRMSAQQKKKYDDRQQSKRRAFNDARKEWGDKVWDAYQKGRITLDSLPKEPPGMFDLNARQLISSRISSQKKAKKESDFKTLQEQNLIKTASEVNVGDRVNYRLNDKYATIVKKNNKTMKIEFEDGTRSTVKLHLLQRESYGDLEKKVQG